MVDIDMDLQRAYALSVAAGVFVTLALRLIGETWIFSAGVGFLVLAFAAAFSKAVYAGGPGGLSK